jgi:hypothetical protein
MLRLIIILALIIPQITYAGLYYEAGQGWPTYTKNGIGHGGIQDEVLWSYYGGQVFTAQDNFTAWGVKMEYCHDATTTNMLQPLAVEVFESENWTATSTLDENDWTYLTFWEAPESPLCQDDGVKEEILSGYPWFEIREVQFVKGRKYFIKIYDGVDHANTKYTRTSPNSNAVSICVIDIFCGGYHKVHSTGVYGLWMSFEGTSQLDMIYGACITSEFPYFNIQQCIVNAAKYLFIPKYESVAQFATLDDLVLSQYPFNILASSTLDSLATSTASTTLTYNIQGYGNFQLLNLASTSQIQAVKDMRKYIASAIYVTFGLLSIFAIIRMI